MIKNSTPLSLPEVAEMAGEGERADKLRTFIKQFTKLSADEARQLKEELTKLDMIKLKDTHIVKIIDFLPEDAADLHKIISEASLDQEETNKILEIVKKY